MRKRKFFDFKYVAHEHRRSYQLACILFSSILLYTLISRHVIGSIEVLGNSMLPLLQQGDRRLVHKYAYWIQSPERGEVVVIRDPETKQLSIKRVIGLPHECLEFRNGKVVVNGLPINEFYLGRNITSWPDHAEDRDCKVPEKSYFLLGDNRLNSADSRTYGPVMKSAILGKVRP